MQYAIPLTSSNQWNQESITHPTNHSRGNPIHSHGKIITKYFALQSKGTITY